jgi:hypothetical protein
MIHSTFILRTLLSLGAFFILSCAGPRPFFEHSKAYTALKAAEVAEATRFSPGYWSKAERLYREGKQAYNSNQNKKAKGLFIRSIRYAEKAENVTRLKKFKSGGAP